MKVFVTGGWGYGNIGDDAILHATIKSLQQEIPQAELLFTSYDPKETEFHHEVKSLYSLHRLLSQRSSSYFPHFQLVFRFFCLLLWSLGYGFTKKHAFVSKDIRELIIKIQQSDLLLMAGGGYFNDLWKASYFSRLAEILIASTVGTRIMVYGQTVGPFNTLISKLVFRKFLHKINFVTYRDVQSKVTLDKYRYPPKQMMLTADEATLLEPKSANLRLYLFKKHRIEVDRLTVGVMIQKFRPYEAIDGTVSSGKIKSESQYIGEITKALCNLAIEHKANIVFLPSTTWDIQTCEAVHDSLIRENLPNVFLIKGECIKEYIGLCQSVDIMLSTNMHPIILAATNNVPSVAISYFYKVDDFMHSIGLENNISRIDQVDAETLMEQLSKLVENLDDAKRILCIRFKTVRCSAHNNIISLVNLVSRT